MPRGRAGRRKQLCQLTAYIDLATQNMSTTSTRTLSSLEGEWENQGSLCSPPLRHAESQPQTLLAGPHYCYQENHHRNEIASGGKHFLYKTEEPARALGKQRALKVPPYEVSSL